MLRELFPLIGARGIADQYGVSRSTVYAWLDDVQIERPKRDGGPPPGRPPAAILRRHYAEEALSIDEIARIYRRGASTIKVWLTEAGVEIRGRGYGPKHAARHPRPSVEDLAAWWAEGRSVEEIAKPYRAAPATVYGWVQRAGLRRPERPRPDAAALRQLYWQERKKLWQIAEMLGVSITTVYEWMKEEGISRRPSGHDPGEPPPVRQLHDVYLTQGLSLPDAAQVFEVGPRTLRSWLEAAGIEIREPGGQPGAGALPRPEPEVLKVWYEEELASTGEIADWCDIAETTARRWLSEAGVQIRPPGKSVQRLGKEPPTAEDLWRLMWEEYLTYDQIAALFDADRTAVPYWLDKHGIPRRTASQTAWKGVELTQEEFLERYESGESLKSIAGDFAASWQTVRELAIAWGMTLRPSGWYVGPPIVCADGHVVRSTYEKRVDDWLTEQGLGHEYEPTTPFPSRWRADFRVGDTYIEVWGVRGQATYEAKKRAKVQAYRRHGIRLIELPYWIFGAREQLAFERRLVQLLDPD